MMTQCEKYGGGRGGIQPPDEDSDRPEWAGGDTDSNTHIKGNDDSGTTRGGDYGDLYVLRRDGNGVPDMTWVDLNFDDVEDDNEWFVQPIDAFGNDIQLDEFGELPEGAPVIEVDFGRLNIVRSPQSVLDQAYAEAMKVLQAPGVEITLDFCGRLTAEYEVDGEPFIKTIDSPRENMAIYQAIMKGDPLDLALTYLDGLDPLTVAASCFAAGSDKTGTVDVDEVVYINGFVNCTGYDPILNEFEYDFNGIPKEYYNFSNPYGDIEGEEVPFTYNRNVYGNRWIKVLVLLPGNTYEYQEFTILEAMEENGLFTERTEDVNFNALTPVEAFAMAVDDAVQVLDYIHGDSNIEFLPNGPTQ